MSALRRRRPCYHASQRQSALVTRFGVAGNAPIAPQAKAEMFLLENEISA